MHNFERAATEAERNNKEVIHLERLSAWNDELKTAIDKNRKLIGL